MVTTLSNLCKAKKCDELQILSIKQELLNYKKKGVLFFMDDLSSLNVNDHFTLYYCIQPNNDITPNAFPIPIRFYYDYITDQNKFNFLKAYFDSYYEKKTFTNELFSLYSKHKAFLSEEYAWFYFQPSDIA